MEEKFMRYAINMAVAGGLSDEVPVGAVIVKNGEVIAQAHNQKEGKNCAVFHAEIEAIIKACERLNNWYLDGCDIYVTLEPCAMCTGAIINSRIENIYFGAYDEKSGCCGSVYNFTTDKSFNHRPNIVGGILKEECAELLSDYFKNKRIANKEKILKNQI